MKNIPLFILSLFISVSLFAQGEIDDEERIFYRNERTFAFSISSNGWGGDFRYGKRLDGYRKRLYSVDLSILKHPRELRRSNPSSLSTNRFVFGKLNNVYTLKVGIGTQKEIFSKRDKGGLGIRHFYTFGPSVGILKPIYYEIIYPMEVKIEKFNYATHSPGNIIGTASFFRGINEVTVSPGIFAKYGFNFEFSKKDDVVNALELGIAGEGYLLPISIMGVNKEYEDIIDDNKHLFFSLFLTYRFGRIIDRYK